MQRSILIPCEFLSLCDVEESELVMSSFRVAVNFKCMLCIHVTVDIIYEYLYIGRMWVCVECA